MEKQRVAVIVPVRNRMAEMRRLLESIGKQDYPLDCISVVVVDAMSTDGTQQVCSLFPFVTLIELAAERHVSRNKGATATDAKYLVQIDSDMEMVPSTISTLVRIAEEEKFDFLSIPERSTGETLWAKARALEKIVIDDDPDRCGARFMLHSAFASVGGYDEQILFSEDYNLHTRLLHAGFRHRVARETFVYHHEGCTIMQAARKQFYYSQSAHLYFRKFKGITLRQYNPFRAAYLKHLKLIVTHPFLFFVLLSGKGITYFTGFLGMCYGYLRDNLSEGRRKLNG
ncbi:glycosyltransferase [Candidatus Parcubacteria bacterium]|nr:MAG: glycosyltransferase [Candidatus Parcubacteria bacterium]